MKKIFEATISPEEIDTEDGGQAKIVVIDDGTDNETGLFVRLHSWDESKEHKDFNELEGKKIRITIETI